MASTMASTLAASRPSEKLGTHSTRVLGMARRITGHRGLRQLRTQVDLTAPLRRRQTAKLDPITGSSHALLPSTLRPRFYLTLVTPKTPVGRFPAHSSKVTTRIICRKDASCRAAPLPLCCLHHHLCLPLPNPSPPNPLPSQTSA